MIKILHFITDTNIGGAGNLLCQQIKGIDKNKFRIFVALPRGSALIKRLKPLHCEIIQFKYGANQSFSIKSAIESYEIIKKVRPDIVHSHSSMSSRIAATVLQIPCRIFTRHCSPPVPQIMKNSLAKWMFGTINGALSTSIIATAECAKQSLIEMGCKKEKITTIINGVAPLRILNDDEKHFLRAQYGLIKENFVISYFARLEDGKGHKYLLEAAKICQEKYPNFRFFIVGAGTQEATLKEYSDTLKINDIVQFIGFCDDVAPIFNISDVNVNCSHVSETSSLSLSEGMSLGIPSVVSDVGGNPYMIKHEENGLVFPTKNSKELARAIIRMYRNKELYKKCSLGAKKRYREELNNEIMCKKISDFYLREYIKSKNSKLKPLIKAK